MAHLDIRAMAPTDIDAAVALYDSGGWEERRSFLETVLANPSCLPLVGILDGALVATGMATANGSVGWVGSIFVDSALRRHGYGRAMTDAVCERLESAGCTTLALIASELGKPIYADMGFRIDGWYQILEALPMAAAPVPPVGTSLRRMRPEDADRVGELDRRATGEDRRGLLGGLADGAWLLESGDELLGFLVQILPDSAAIVAPVPENGAFLLDLLRHLGHGRSKRVRAAAFEWNEDGQSMIEGRGWSPTFATPRMLRGGSIDWAPAMIWSILGFAFG